MTKSTHANKIQSLNSLLTKYDPVEYFIGVFIAFFTYSIHCGASRPHPDATHAVPFHSLSPGQKNALWSVPIGPRLRAHALGVVTVRRQRIIAGYALPLLARGYRVPYLRNEADLTCVRVSSLRTRTHAPKLLHQHDVISRRAVTVVCRSAPIHGTT